MPRLVQSRVWDLTTHEGTLSPAFNQLTLGQARCRRVQAPVGRVGKFIAFQFRGIAGFQHAAMALSRGMGVGVDPSPLLQFA